MTANRLKERLNAGKPCINGWLLLPSTFSAEVMAQTGWDSLTIDLQHGLHDYHSAVAAIQAMQAHPVPHSCGFRSTSRASSERFSMPVLGASFAP